MKHNKVINGPEELGLQKLGGKFSPVVLFVYNRPWHTQQTINALKKNLGAEKTDLFIYCDGPVKGKVTKEIEEVRKIVKSVDGFSSVSVLESEKNLGLADSIVRGVSLTLEANDSVIVLEDDMVTSRYFLNYMNKCLNYFADNKDIWHVSGWNYPIDGSLLSDVFFTRLMNCWGWGTWSDRWSNFSRNAEEILREFDSTMVHEFTLEKSASTFWKQIEDNFSGTIKTWAIFWYATIFRRNGLCVNPRFSYVRNIGLDGSGVHCQTLDSYEHSALSDISDPNLDVEITESRYALNLIKLFIRRNRPSIFSRGRSYTLRLIKKIKSV